MSITQATLPDGRPVRFIERSAMRRKTKRNTFLGELRAPSLPAAPASIDWSNGNKIQMPILGNAQYSNCFMASACHQAQVWTGNTTGTPLPFDEATVVKEYLKLAGGDKGLYEEQLVNYWETSGLPGFPKSKLIDSCDISPLNAELMQRAIYFFGGVQFQLSVPTKWLNNFKTGGVWDGGVKPNPLNGHAVYLFGYDLRGYYLVATWGSWCYMTPAGLASCDPDAFVAIGGDLFNAAGYAPTNKHYLDYTSMWSTLGGTALPAGNYPAPSPTPTPTPTPTPSSNIWGFTGQIDLTNRTLIGVLNDPPPTN